MVVPKIEINQKKKPHTSFSRILDDKNTPFSSKIADLRSNKYPFLNQNAISLPLYKIKYLFVKATTIIIISNARHFSMYIVFFITSDGWKSEWKQAGTCQIFTPFQKFADLCLKMAPLSWFQSRIRVSHWKHAETLETFSASLAICAGNSLVTGEFPAHRPVTQSFDVFFDLRLNKRLSKQSRGWWFETPSRSLWRQYNEYPHFTRQWVSARMYTMETSLIARFMGPTWGPSGADRTQVGPMLAPWSLLSGLLTQQLT